VPEPGSELNVDLDGPTEIQDSAKKA